MRVTNRVVSILLGDGADPVVALASRGQRLEGRLCLRTYPHAEGLPQLRLGARATHVAFGVLGVIVTLRNASSVLAAAVRPRGDAETPGVPPPPNLRDRLRRDAADAAVVRRTWLAGAGPQHDPRLAA